MMKKRILQTGCILLMAGMLIIPFYGCGKRDQSGDEEKNTVTAESEESKDAVAEEEKDTTEGFLVYLSGNNSWENNGMVCSQFDGTIKNTTKESGKDWKILVTVPEGTVLENSWNGTYSIDGNTLVITPADYNTEVGAGQEITFGFIMDTKEAFTPEEVVLSIGGREYAMGEVSKDEETDSGNASEESSQTQDKAADDKEAAPPKEISGTPLDNHGALSVKGTDIVDAKGEKYQLKGVSTHGINWFPDYVNKEAFSSLAGFGVNAIRLAMYTADYNGYCSGGAQTDLENLIEQGVTACSELGMYVIIDWHILNDNNPNQNKDAAKAFFEKMSKKYADYENVLYEICNEPNGGTTWADVKGYSEEIIPVIRKNDKNALIIVGTPNWSQDVDIASKDKLEGFDNIIYAAHFYASTHKGEIREKVKTARENGLPVMISECSICEASGNGSINYEEAQNWMDMINEYHLSFFAWNLSNKDEQSSLLKPSVTKTKDFKEEDFSETGAWFIKQFEE